MAKRASAPAHTTVVPFELSRQTSSDGRRCVLVLAGELDMATAGRLESMVAQALVPGLSELVLDMRAVTFTDSIGLRAMLRSRRMTESHGAQFFLMPSQGGRQHRLLTLSGLIDEFTFRAPGEADAGAEEG